MKSFFLAVQNPLEKDKLIQFIDRRPEVINWYTFGAIVFLISDYDLSYLGSLIHNGVESLFFVICEIDQRNIQGWMPEQAWDFVLNPRPATAYKKT